MTNQINAFNRSQSFDLKNAIDIRKSSNYSETTIKNANDIKLDSLSLSDTFKNSQSGKIGKIEVVVEEKDSGDLDYKRFFEDIIEGSKSLSREEKDNVSELVQKAIEKNKDYSEGSWTSDKESMYHLQTKKQLELIATTLLPDSMQNTFLQASEKYTDQKLEDTVDASKKIYDVIYNRYKDEVSGPFKQIADQMKGALNEISSGSHITQTEQRQYETLYDNLDMSSGYQMKQSYEKVLEGYSEIQREQLQGHWNNSSRSRTEEIVNLLREDWNKFVSSVSTFNEYQVFSKSSSVVNTRI